MLLEPWRHVLQLADSWVGADILWLTCKETKRSGCSWQPTLNYIVQDSTLHLLTSFAVITCCCEAEHIGWAAPLEIAHEPLSQDPTEQSRRNVQERAWAWLRPSWLPLLAGAVKK
jgi:hypothetical protein